MRPALSHRRSSLDAQKAFPTALGKDGPLVFYTDPTCTGRPTQDTFAVARPGTEDHNGVLNAYVEFPVGVENSGQGFGKCCFLVTDMPRQLKYVLVVHCLPGDNDMFCKCTVVMIGDSGPGIAQVRTAPGQNQSSPIPEECSMC